MTTKSLRELLALNPEEQKSFESDIKAFQKKQRQEDVLVPGVVYLKHIPHGFYENEMYKYFSQFGKIKNLRLGRSKKTGGSRGYAYIEFQCDEVAKIVAETMNNYLMFDQLMKCKFIPPEMVHPLTLRVQGKIHLAKSVTMFHQNKWKCPEKERKNLVKRAKDQENQARLAELGVTFDFDLRVRYIHFTLYYNCLYTSVYML
ncbi:MKI67 FHA domain-interacting nucleolar phosphoprotein-like [Tachypleus tridentatus]|uniref:MKI67 FHA domain-interacting nucleolar phosphoprotein-like n=1 Tax=Tachypleus tridentatus TaxID=6853 RepID=UPI003FD49ABC